MGSGTGWAAYWISSYLQRERLSKGKKAQVWGLALHQQLCCSGKSLTCSAQNYPGVWGEQMHIILGAWRCRGVACNKHKNFSEVSHFILNIEVDFAFYPLMYCFFKLRGHFKIMFVHYNCLPENGLNLRFIFPPSPSPLHCWTLLWSYQATEVKGLWLLPQSTCLVSHFSTFFS